MKGVGGRSERTIVIRRSRRGGGAHGGSLLSRVAPHGLGISGYERGLAVFSGAEGLKTSPFTGRTDRRPCGFRYPERSPMRRLPHRASSLCALLRLCALCDQSGVCVWNTCGVIPGATTPATGGNGSFVLFVASYRPGHRQAERLRRPATGRTDRRPWRPSLRRRAERGCGRPTCRRP